MNCAKYIKITDGGKIMYNKNVLKTVFLVFLVCAMLALLTSCSSKLNGTYVSEDGLIKQSFTFKEDNIVEVSAFGIEVKGRYAIDDDKITITYSLFSLSYNWEKSFTKSGNSIFIDGIEFIKEN